MYQITENMSRGILSGMSGSELKKQAFLGGVIGKGLGLGAKAISKFPGAAISGLFAAPIGISAAQRMMPPGGLRRAFLGPKMRSSLTSPVKSPQDPLF